MNTDTTLQINSDSSEMTEKLAEQLGANLRGGETLVLQSDLGGGKTTFVRGLAKGMGSIDHVASPTFTISREYTAIAKHLKIVHFDFYRLQDAGIVAQELKEYVTDPTVVAVVEWGGIVKDVLPIDRLTVHIVPTGDQTRQITFTCQTQLTYILKGVA